MFFNIGDVSIFIGLKVMCVAQKMGLRPRFVVVQYFIEAINEFAHPLQACGNFGSENMLASKRSVTLRINIFSDCIGRKVTRISLVE